MPGDEPTRPVGALVEHLFRRSHGRLVAALARILGARHLELAEDVVGEALLRALRVWPFQGVPDDPESWLVRVARNQALDALRRDRTLTSKEDEVRAWAERRAAALARPDEPAGLEGELRDEALGLVFACCHPALSEDARVALTLKTACGLGVPEIARAFLSSEPTVAQRLVRAKRRLSELDLPLELPGPGELAERLDSVLEALYLMFNEGAYRTSGDTLVRADLVAEALRLAGLLVLEPRTSAPRVHALLALMQLQAARLPARLDAAGDLLVLADQDRSQWDRDRIARGFHHLQRASQGDELSRYHLEAGIAACHAQAESFATTDWRRILGFYDLLLERHPSPVAALNRLVALAEVEGPERALRELAPLEDEPALARYHLRPAVRGELLRRAGRDAEATAAFREALELVRTDPERRLLEGRLRRCADEDA